MKIQVLLTEAAFRRFSLFDLFVHRRAWRAPALFALILSFCAGCSFWMHAVRGAVLLGGVLLAVGLGLPAVYFGSFLLSVHKQAQAQGLPRTVYTLQLSAQGVEVFNQTQQARYPWQGISRVYRDASASYLYITPARAFILPHDCLGDPGPEGLWSLLSAHLPEDRLLRR